MAPGGLTEPSLFESYYYMTIRPWVTIFLPEINKVFLRPILQNLKGRSVLDKFFFENDPLDELNQMPLSKKFYIFRELVKNAK